ncbi:lysophospholipid acyltransferase family protein [Thermodesulforhabdus norvegica]|uniref:KDO2-lipid IV(A) lauroyltransferase n=1 Tax=Thermodesulforhabdus norvegica TaxID=39841 RepID=A0A1I4V9K8_9BACT|nr:lysophospholipid acyltransferase family protein [Thermodesulforhabdus norvegica]SFM97889.1 KDO2-lipid IV(A) lauroyltransferase [Thermodesulforhabdus norvegica]
MKDRNLFFLWHRIIPGWADLLGKTWFRLHTSRRTVAVDNIVTALKCSEAEAAGIALRNFVHLARVFLEFPLLPLLNEGNVRYFVSYTGEENFHRAKNLGPGILILTGHFGNWELMAYATPLVMKVSLDIIARPLDNALLNRLTTRIRTRTGNRLIDKNFSFWKMTESLKNGRPVGILLDQKASQREGIYAPFFGRLVLTHRALAILACKTSCPVLPVYNYRKSDGTYTVRALPPLMFEKPTGKAIYEATARFNEIFEKIIQEHPDQWYWIHRRFRYSKPINS